MTVASTEIYNPNLATWTNAASMSVPRRNHTATLLGDGRVLVRTYKRKLQVVL